MTDNTTSEKKFWLLYILFLVAGLGGGAYATYWRLSFPLDASMPITGNVLSALGCLFFVLALGCSVMLFIGSAVLVLHKDGILHKNRRSIDD